MTNDTPAQAEPGDRMIEGDISHETLMRYLDGELPPEERRRVEEAVERSTELRREITIYRSLHEDLATLSFETNATRGSVWDSVHKRLTRPIGWLLFATGVVAWLIHAVFEFASSESPSWEKLATSAVVIGILLLFASVIHDRYREFLTDPYRKVER
jgi:anti-sigma factor RsiW